MGAGASNLADKKMRKLAGNSPLILISTILLPIQIISYRTESIIGRLILYNEFIIFFNLQLLRPTKLLRIKSILTMHSPPLCVKAKPEEPVNFVFRRIVGTENFSARRL